MKKEKLLLHCCCGPCTIHVIDELKDDFSLILYFYNPNIYPIEEYIKRKWVLLDYAIGHRIFFIEQGYSPDEFYQRIEGLENEKEGGTRCTQCFDLRLLKSAKKAKELKINFFSTTLTISPHKDSKKIFSIGHEIAAREGLTFFARDFKKKDGFKLAIKKSREQGFYLQNYCGCRFSLKERKERNG